MANTTTLTQEINGLYVSLFGAAATNAGIAYWVGVVEAHDSSATPNGLVSTADAVYLAQQMASSQSTYFTHLYGSLNDLQFVQALYTNIGGAAINNATAIQYWFNQLEAAEVQYGTANNSLLARAAVAGEFVQALAGNNLNPTGTGNAAANAAYFGLSLADYNSVVTDQQALLNKIEVSQYFAIEAALDPTLLNYTSESQAAFTAAQDVLLGVSSNPASVTTAENAINLAVSEQSLTPILDLGPQTTGQTYTLTTSVDAAGTGAFIYGEPTGNNNIIFGTFNGTGATFTPGDDIAPVAGSTGNIMYLADMGTNGIGNVNAAAATVANVQTVNISSAEAIWINTATSGNFTGLTQLNVSTSTPEYDSANHYPYTDIYVAATTNVNVNDYGYDSYLYVYGGNNIVVSETGYEMYIEVGDGAPYNPAGTVTVTDTGYGDGDIYVYGGVGTGTTAGTAAVYINATTTYGDYIVVGDDIPGYLPTGTVYVTNTATYPYDDIINTYDAETYVYGGTNVTVVSNGGYVQVGDDTNNPFTGEDPSGNVSVTSTQTGIAYDDVSVEVYGGHNVTISALAGSIYVGAGSVTSNPTGTVMITENGVNTGYHYYNEIWVDGSSGGGGVTITTTGAGDGIYAGWYDGLPVSGPVVITDTYSGQYHDDIYVYGGTTVSITENATETEGISHGYNTVGYGDGTTAYTAGTDLTYDPTGNVVINNSTTYTSGSNAGDTQYGGGGFAVYTNGSASVSVTGGYDQSDYIVDAQSQITGGTSTLASISLTGVSDSDVYIIANALSTLSLTSDTDDDVYTENTAASTGLVVNAADVDLGLYIENTAALTGLVLNLSNGSDLYVDDVNSEVGGTVTVNASGTLDQDFEFALPVATGLVITNAGSGYLFVDGSAPKVTSITTSGTGSGELYLDVVAPDATTITVSNTGYVDLYDVKALGDTALTAINAGLSKGGIEVTLNGDTTSFTGGSGVSTVTLVDVVGLSHLINGGSGTANEVILTNISGMYVGVLGGPIYNSAEIENFQYLGFDGALDGAPGASGTYNVSGFTGVDIYGAASALTLTAASAGETLTFDNGATVGTTTWAETAAGALTVYLDTDETNDLATTNVTSITLYNEAVDSFTLSDLSAATTPTTAITVTGAGDLGLTDTDTKVTSLTVSGAVGLTIESGSLDGVKTISYSGSDYLVVGQLTDNLTTITDSGSGALYFGAPGSAGGVSSALSTVNAASSSGLVEGSAVNSTAGVTFTGGSGLLEVAGSDASTTVVDSYTSGSGGASILLGAGGAGSYTAGEFVNLSAAVDVRSGFAALTAPVAGDGTRAIVTGFTNFVLPSTGNSFFKESDVLNTATSVSNAQSDIFNDPTVIATNLTGVTGSTGTTLATYTISDGVFTMTVAGTGPSFNEIQDVQTILNAAGANEIGIVQIGSTTYVVESAATLAGDIIIQLNGVTGITGFAAAAWSDGFAYSGEGASSGTTIATADGLVLTGVTANAGAGNGGTAAGTTYNDTGYMVDTLTVNMNTATTVDTYNNLGNFAILDVGGALTQGEVVVTQVGTNPELVVQAEGAFTLNSLTAGGQVLLSADGGSITIDSLVTPGAGLYITGADSVTVDAISASALSNITAYYNTASVTLGTSTTPLTEANLHIEGQNSGGGSLTVYSSGGDLVINADLEYGAGIATLNVTASGADDTILGGNSITSMTVTANNNYDYIFNGYDYGTGSMTVTANGNNDTIYAENNSDTITANGNSDLIGIEANGLSVVTAGGTADAIYDGDGTGEIGAAGKGDYFDVYDGTFHLAANAVSSISSATGSLGANDTIYVSDATAHMWVGENTTIYLSDDSFADVHLLGDVTGGSSSSYMQTTINGVGVGGDTLRLHFDTNQSYEVWAGGTSENSQVNVATATSLANALDIAASQAAVINYQFDGHDYATTVGTSVAIDGYTGLIDWFQYQGNTYIVEANNTGSSAAAHGALGASDIVVELTGLVDVNHISVATHT